MLKSNQLYKEYSGLIRNYLLRFVDPTDAEDLTQDVFIKVDQNIGKLRDKSTVKSWVFRIATNTALDYLNSGTHRLSSNKTDISEKDLVDFDKVLEAEKKIDAAAMRDCMLEFIQRLPKDYSAILLLSEFEELSGKEISEILDVKLGTIKVRLHRARARLKKELINGCEISTNSDDQLECVRKAEQ